MAEVAEGQPELVKLKKDSVILVDRVVNGTLPDYCIHGHTWCIRCHSKVWLGTATLEAARAGAQPLCLTCANDLAEKGLLPTDGPREHLDDHRRADGPHE